MELGTFGAVLKFAYELESNSIAFYKELAEKSQGESRTIFSSFADGSKKNQQLLEKTRRMNVVEMILEAITGLNSDLYNADLRLNDDFLDCVKKAITLEENATKFYKDASNKLGFLPNVKSILEKLGKDRESRIAKLRSLL
ncbi:MAG: hypothetical protein ACUVQ5_04040 [Candidatus Methanomethylicaceae archaeon]